jgi:hypothetical protein
MIKASLPMQQRVLAFAIGFRDRFLPSPDDPPIPVPLEVESLGQRAFGGADGTYRISVTGTPPVIPTGTFPISVRAPGGQYVTFDPIEVTLPLPVSIPPQRSDYLLLQSLWPTRMLSLPTGETALAGTITEQGLPRPGLTVLLHEGTTPPSGTPDARTDATGSFLYRLPFARGATSPSPLSFNLTVLDGATVLAVTPAAVALVPGRTNNVSFAIP